VINEKPTLFVFAGNNGSGKSTLRNLIGEKIGIKTSIDPDSLTRKHQRFNVKSPEIQAGKEAITLIRTYIADGNSFSMETTLSGKTSLRQIKNASKNGFEVIMFFIGLDHVDLNIARVKQRVKSGGHHIPEKDIIRREERVKRNLLKIISYLDQIIVLDNTEEQAEMIMNFKNNSIYYAAKELPPWAKDIKKELHYSKRS